LNLAKFAISSKGTGSGDITFSLVLNREDESSISAVFSFPHDAEARWGQSYYDTLVFVKSKSPDAQKILEFLTA
jgi:hypothetical protein